MDDKKRDDDHVVDLEDLRPNGTGHLLDGGTKSMPSNLLGSSSGSAGASVQSITNNPMISILCYCASSILMTCANKYVVNGSRFNLPFFLGSVQVSLAKILDSID